MPLEIYIQWQRVRSVPASAAVAAMDGDPAGTFHASWIARMEAASKVVQHVRDTYVEYYEALTTQPAVRNAQGRRAATATLISNAIRESGETRKAMQNNFRTPITFSAASLGAALARAGTQLGPQRQRDCAGDAGLAAVPTHVQTDARDELLRAVDAANIDLIMSFVLDTTSAEETLAFLGTRPRLGSGSLLDDLIACIAAEAPRRTHGVAHTPSQASAGELVKFLLRHRDATARFIKVHVLSHAPALTSYMRTVLHTQLHHRSRVDSLYPGALSHEPLSTEWNLRVVRSDSFFLACSFVDLVIATKFSGVADFVRAFVTAEDAVKLYRIAAVATQNEDRRRVCLQASVAAELQSKESLKAQRPPASTKTGRDLVEARTVWDTAVRWTESTRADTDARLSAAELARLDVSGRFSLHRFNLIRASPYIQRR